MNIRQHSELPVDPISSLNNAMIRQPLVLTLVKYSSGDNFLLWVFKSTYFSFFFFLCLLDSRNSSIKVSGDGSTGFCLLIMLRTEDIKEINTDYKATYLVCSVRSVNTVFIQRCPRLSVYHYHPLQHSCRQESVPRNANFSHFSTDFSKKLHYAYSINFFKDHIDCHVLKNQEK
jgi:hypothetical protein